MKLNNNYNPAMNSGFALVLALSLMSFVLVLLLSMATLVRVEVQGSNVQKQQLQARQSALLGLHVAVGELQTLAGSDQRITATAELAENPDTVKNPHWTGVWRNAGTVSVIPGKSVPNKQLLSWLISGNENIAFPSGTSDAQPRFTPFMDLNRNIAQLSPGSGDSEVTLVGANSVDLSTSDVDGDGLEDGGGVVAPLVEVLGSGNQVVCRYAYWVGDEGVKARLNINDHNVGATVSSKEGRVRLSVPSRSAAELFSAEVDPDPDLWGSLYSANDPRNERVHLTDDFTNVLNTDPVSASSLLRSNYHNLSASSESLLVDAKNGGLKHDLTTATRLRGQDWLDFKNAVTTGSSEQIFPPMTVVNPTNQDPGGPYWDALQSFVQNGADSTGITPRAHSLDSHGFAPIVQEFKMMGGPSIVGTGSGRSFRMHYMPVATLWNPYDQPIKAQDYYFVFGPLDTRLRVLVGLSPEHWTENGVTPDTEARLDVRPSSRPQPPAIVRDRTFRFVIRSPEIPPGRAMVFTPPVGGQALIAVSSTPTDSSEFNVLEAGYRVGANFYVDFDTPLNDLEENDEIYHLSLRGGDGSNTDLLMGLSPEGLRESPIFDLVNSYMYRLDFYSNVKSLYQRVTLSGSPSGAPLINEEIVDLDGSYSAEPVFAYWIQLRMLEDMLGEDFNKTIPFLRSYNPRGPLHHHSQLEDRTGNNKSFRTLPTYWRGLIWEDENGVFYNVNVDDSDTYSYPGYSSSSIFGETFIAFRAFQADTDIYSIGDLMHANLIPGLADPELNIAHKHIGANYPSYAVGSSAQSPYIEANSTIPYRNEWPSGSRNLFSGGTDNLFYDLPYLLNDALWDHFYFSAIDETTLKTLNSRYQGIGFQEIGYDPADSQSFSEKHAVIGGFNVNSTSVDAWAAVLGAYLGINSEANSNVAANESLFDRVAFASSTSFQAGENASQESAWGGSRKLNSTEIRSLATAVAAEVKSRGPFLSLADFVNRNLTDTSVGEAHKRGALDAAIGAAGVNVSLIEPIGSDILQWNAANFPPGGNGFGLHNLEALTEPLADSIPGALSQPDLLAKFGSILTVRSDTFTVRFYGDAVDPISGDATARAWGEATIQRTLEPVDPSSANSREPSVETADTLGRRYKIIGIRWLNADEV